MLAKRLGLVTIMFGVAVLTGCAAALIKGGPPAGPIIVVQPDPEPSTPVNSNPKGTIQCASGDEPCWYLGSFDSNHFDLLPHHIDAKDRTGENPPKLPYYLMNNATVNRMEIRLKPEVKTPIEISKIELTLGSDKLVIEVTNPNEVPKWTFKGDRILDKGTSRERLPALLLTRITGVTVVERPYQPQHPDVTTQNLKQLRIYYNQ